MFIINDIRTIFFFEISYYLRRNKQSIIIIYSNLDYSKQVENIVTNLSLIEHLFYMNVTNLSLMKYALKTRKNVEN